MARIRWNKAQREAVEHDLGPMLVLAGAGSGKTGVVTQRIAELIRKGVSARSILAVTFTNKAATEMRERIVRLTGARASSGLLSCTFHRFGLEVLSKETKALGLRRGRFAIFDRGDCLGVVRDAMRSLVTGRTYDVSAILSRISMAKNAFVTPEQYEQRSAEREDPYDEITGLVYGRYQETLRSLQAFDFDDLVCEPVHLWRRRPEVLERWRMRFRYLIVDEYQDTNTAQFALLDMLAREHHNLCVVGDDDQAIYAWRGADVRNILEFDKKLPDCKVVKLQRNYRSRASILAVANALLSASKTKRHEKTLIATKPGGDKVRLVEARDAEVEAQFVADEIKQLVDSKGMAPRDVAVLYRSNIQSGDLESELKARGLPYQLFGGTQVFERKEVKDVLAYLAVALHSYNELAVRRSLNYPPRGIGTAAFKKLVAHATIRDTSLYRAVEQAHGVAELSDSARAGCREYARIIADINRGIDAEKPSAEIVRDLVATLELRAQIQAESGKNNRAAARRWANIEFLLRAFVRHDARRTHNRAALEAFLRKLMLREDEQDDTGDGDNKVTLTTMHGAKGLEFPVVFVVGLEEGLLPHARTTEERATDAPAFDSHEIDELEQERRLFYVAITRAKDHLYLCRALARSARGKALKRAPSRFLLDLPEELLEHQLVMETGSPDASEVKRGADDVLAAILAATGNKA